MKVKAINRSAAEGSKERSQDLQKVHKNLDPSLHPFEKAVEYTRALNAAKLDRWAAFSQRLSVEPRIRTRACQSMHGDYNSTDAMANTCRIFAKPFIAAFPHDDGVTCLARNPKLLNGIVRFFSKLHTDQSAGYMLDAIFEVGAAKLGACLVIMDIFFPHDVF